MVVQILDSELASAPGRVIKCVVDVRAVLSQFFIQALNIVDPNVDIVGAIDNPPIGQDFATLADWEIAGGWTTVKGERVKDEGILEKFDVALEEAQTMVMTARVMLGWVAVDDMAPQTEEEAEE